MRSNNKSRAEQNRIVENFLKSGVGVPEFCKQQGIVYGTFQKWRVTYERSQKPSSAFVPVILKSQNEIVPHRNFVGAKLISPKGIVIDFDSRADHGWISQILRGVL